MFKQNKLSRQELANENSALAPLLVNTRIANPPYYVANIPVKVDSDDDADTSAGEEEDDSFPEDYFKNPSHHFRLLPQDETGQRGRVLSPLEEPNKIIVNNTPIKNDRRTRLFKIFKEESFGSNSDQSIPVAKERMALCFGLNKMRSLSKSGNQSLFRSTYQPLTMDLSVRRLGFFWDGVWEESINGGKNWKRVTYQRVHAFYRQLKKKNRVAALTFRKEVEKYRAHMIPYREIREAIKNSVQTQELVQQQKAKAQESDVYLAFFDGDTLGLRSGGIGTMSVYDALSAKHEKNKLEIASTGYALSADSDPILSFAVLCDMVVRTKTAAFIKRGIYYPEPSAIVRVLPGQTTVKESFTVLGEKDYESPQEMPILIDHIVTQRKLDPQSSMEFEAAGAVVTTLPDRMDRVFFARLNGEGKIVHWGLDTFKTIRGISQTHYNSRDWAWNVLEAFTVPKKIEYSKNKIKLNQKEIRNFLISLIATMFSSYDPVDVSSARQSKFRGFQVALQDTLVNYQKVTPIVVPTKLKRINKKPEIKALWQEFDSIKTIEELRQKINLFLVAAPENKLTVEDIEKAAKSAGEGISILLTKQLCVNFFELSIDLMNSVFETMFVLQKRQFVVDNATLCHPYPNIIDGEALFAKEATLGTFRSMKNRVLGIYQTYPLHWAAITGNLEMVRWLLSKSIQSKLGWIGEKNKAAQGGVLPIHCAMAYCAQNGDDFELLKLLCDEATVMLSGEGVTIFQLAFEIYSEPLPILDFFVENYSSSLEVSADLFGDRDINDLLVLSIAGDFSNLADFIAPYVDAEQEILDAILEDAPDSNSHLVKWAQDCDYELSWVIESLSESDRVLFTLNFGLNDDPFSDNYSEDNNVDEEEYDDDDDEDSKTGFSM